MGFFEFCVLSIGDIIVGEHALLVAGCAKAFEMVVFTRTGHGTEAHPHVIIERGMTEGAIVTGGAPPVNVVKPARLQGQIVGKVAVNAGAFTNLVVSAHQQDTLALVSEVALIPL